MRVYEKLTYAMYTYTSFAKYVPRATGGWARQALPSEGHSLMGGQPSHQETWEIINNDDSSLSHAEYFAYVNLI